MCQGWSLRYSPVWHNRRWCIVALYVRVWGVAVREGTALLAQISASFQSLPPPPTSKLGTSGADSQVGGLVYVLRPCGSLQQTLLWGWEFLLPPQSPQVFSVRGLRLYFLRPEPWVAQSVSLPSCSSRFIHTRMWDHPVLQPQPRHKSSPPTARLCPSYRSGWAFVF